MRTPVTILSTTLTLAAATLRTVIDSIDLTAYERVDIAMENTGSNDVTAATWKGGVSDGHTTIGANDNTQATAVVDALTAGGKSVTTLTGSDIPAKLAVTLTSSSGSTVKVLVTGCMKASELFPTV